MLDIGNRYYGLLYVIGDRSDSGVRKYMCLCECGKTKWIRKDSVTSGHTKSCGCLIARRATTHGLSANRRNTGYTSWIAMKDRCCNPKTPHYSRYGGRGISVCERWMHCFENFIADMGPRPSPRHSIERIDNSGNYCPENCKWAAPVEQANNRRSNVCVTAFGVTRTVAEWSRLSGLKHATILNRLNSGIDADSAVSLPPARGKALKGRVVQ
jgi:hypothetical protein